MKRKFCVKVLLSAFLLGGGGQLGTLSAWRTPLVENTSLLPHYICLTNREPLLSQTEEGIDTCLWVVEDHSDKAVFQTRGDTIEISTPKGLTLWYKPRLTGDYEITYSACMPMDGDPNDRLSDLNCFWGANDPQHLDNLFSRSEYRHGIFQRYKTLTLFYVGYGCRY